MSAIARAKALALADQQLGLVTRTQLVCCGLSTDQIKYLVRTGALLVVHRSVYRVAGAPDGSRAQSALAACLACGAGAVVSHVSAASLRGLTDIAQDVVDVTVPPNRAPVRPGIRVHRALVGDGDRTFSGVVPVTTVERTLVDLAGQVTSVAALEESADRAFRGRLTSPPRMDAYLRERGAACPKGIGKIRAIVDDRLGRGVPESVLESKMIGLLRRIGLPAAIRQFETVVAGHRVRFDLAYPDARVAIELEGRGPHWGRERWQSDHRRDNSTEVGGWRKLGFTWWDVTNDELYVAITVGEALGLRPRSWRSSR